MNDMTADQWVNVAPVPPPGELQIAGFWRRTVAFIVDGLVLAIPAAILGNIFFDQAAALGLWGRAIGFAVFIAYFAFMDSRICSGQSLGKRLMEIRVVDRYGNNIDVEKSAARCLIVAIPYFLNGTIPADLLMRNDLATKYLVMPLVSLVVFGVGGAIVYLYIFNKKTRQSLQDLAVGSFVVRESPAGAVTKSIRRYHLAIAACLCLISLAAPPIVATVATKALPSGVWSGLTDIRSALLASPDIREAQVTIGASTVSMTGSGTKTTTFLQVAAQLRSRPANPEDAELSVAETVLKLHPDLMGRELLTISVGYGFDLGIATWRHSVQDTAMPTEWMRRINARHTQAPAQAT